MSEEPPEAQQSPEPLAYAAIPPGLPTEPLRLPRVALVRSLKCSLIALAAALFELFAHSGLCISVFLGVIASIVALILAVVALWRNFDTRLRDEMLLKVGHVALVLILALAMCAAHAMLTITLMARARNAAFASVSASNLRGVGQCLAIYTREYSTPPPSFNELISSSLITPKQLISPFDPQSPGESINPPHYSSYVYQPIEDPDINDAMLIIGYERKPITTLDARLFSRYGRWVLYGDGHVEALDAEAFERAILKDEQRRRELGWYIPPRP
ncbi:MAG: hypothetical protein ABIG44_12300 [Planctomycetota bacterium]